MNTDSLYLYTTCEIVHKWENSTHRVLVEVDWAPYWSVIDSTLPAQIHKEKRELGNIIQILHTNMTVIAFLSF